MYLFCGAIALVFAGLCATSADEFRFERQADWDTWTFPRGAVAQNEDGSIGLERVDRKIDAVADAREFLHAVKRTKEPVPGGVHVVGTGAETAANIMDGRLDTWWQPDTVNVLEDWFIEVDLGRMVLANKIRLTFPDTLDVRPFRTFSVFVNDGVRASAARDIFVFSRVGRTTEPNTERVVEFDLETVWPGAATGEHLVNEDTLKYQMVQYVRFLAEEFQPDGALARIEVETLGDNVVLGSVGRGGGIRGGTDQGNLSGIIDGDKNSAWTISGAADWISEGHWFEFDLGATYWVDQAFYYISRARTVFGDFEITTAEGAPAGGLTTERVRSNLDFQHLSLVETTASPWRRLFEFRFPPRKVRHTFLRRINIEECSQCVLTSLTDFYLFGEGFVAEAVMESGFIDLGGTKSIRRLTWDAEMPPGTFVEIRSQTGDTFVIEQKFYNKNGVEVSEAQWNKLPKSQKQDIVEIQRRGQDWSGWGPVYDFPGEVFLSPTPRKFAQLQVKLGNDNPGVAPLLRRISLHFDDALVSGGITSRILPREAGFDSLQTFTYVLTPTFRFGDEGFDRIRIRVPAPAEGVEITVGGEVVVPVATAMVGDSLQVDLPQRVERDSVEVVFKTRIQANATIFDAWVSVAGDDLRQGVRAEAQYAATVFVPSVATGGALIRSVAVSPLVTPNGDGINDEAQIRFTLAKVEGASPAVTIHDLSGRQVRTVDAVDGAHNWDGRDASGQLLPPGSYVCRILLSADVGERAAYRMIGVAY
ncbi:MAG TPA: gliding motility-associated C-terminal domain-containing protein [Candidatus Latescibacteria bacterium]|jgi:hypothetical protein|nr:gliding motility-associated C-terminal domain-containing protein [Candidatus Latescibacterota bacterium]HJP31613.1 gliding motility-associated C-terminal domain-containing protein [Candidatus Latescibacterota bacterium]